MGLSRAQDDKTCGGEKRKTTTFHGIGSGFWGLEEKDGGVPYQLQ
jgi:hypothetical protein